MSFSDEIEDAILAHAIWKQRLQSAVQTGASEYTVMQITASSDCTFGKWLHGPSGVRTLPAEYEKIQELHAAFHREAGRVLSMALSGHKEEALSAMEPGSRYILLSGQLAATLRRLQESSPEH